LSDAFAQTLRTMAASRAAVVARVRTLATRLDELPLDGTPGRLSLVIAQCS
jgi:hypothetical protein